MKWRGGIRRKKEEGKKSPPHLSPLPYGERERVRGKLSRMYPLSEDVIRMDAYALSSFAFLSKE